MNTRRLFLRICKAAVVVFVLAYLFALFVLASGSYGWFGAAKDPLAGVFLIPLGLPWNAFLPASVATGIVSPILNGALMWFFCRRLSR